MTWFGATFWPRTALVGAALACAAPATAAEPIPPEFAEIVAGSGELLPQRAEIPPTAFRSASGPSDTEAAALSAALDRLVLADAGRNPLGAGDWRAARAAIGAFYASRLFTPLWVDAHGLTQAGRAATSTLTRASDDGLDLGAFAPPRVAAGLSAEGRSQAEAEMAAAIVVYAEQATGSRITPSRISPLLNASPQVADPGEALAETAAATDPGARLADFNPPQQGYRLLREAFKRAAALSARPGLVASDTSEIVTRIALDNEGLAPPRAGRRGAPQPVLASLNPIGANPSLQRRRAILANMEMWRWEPRDMGARRIEVNVPDFSVTLIEGDTVVHRARVVVGRPDTPTPIFSDLMRYVVINPSWQVPDSIIKKEMLSKLGSLGRRGFEVKTVNGRITVRQLPGERNALGRLAFMFPNDHAVYLHDTPAQSLFDEEARAFSHGCVRVEDPVRLAELVLGWPESQIEATFGPKERSVFLPRPLPIHIEYFTEFVDEYGELRERPDIYGLTQRVEFTLAAKRQD